MGKYRLTFKKSVARDLRHIAKRDLRRTLDRIDSLADAPRGKACLKLAVREHYRVRVGDYRIVYAIEDDRLVVQVVKIAHRSDAYDRS